MTRTAIVTLRGSDTVETVARYLPSNYAITGVEGDQVTIAGEDFAGWTMDGYVLPRLRSGMIPVKEVEA